MDHDIKKSIDSLNVSSNVLISHNFLAQKSSNIYEASNTFSTAVIINAVFHYFYEFSLIKIFLTCIFIGCFLALILKSYLIALNHFSNYTIANALESDHYLFVSQIAIVKIHLSLLVFASCAINDTEHDDLLRVLPNIFTPAILFVLTCSAVFYIVEKTIFKSQFDLNQISIEGQNSASILI